MLAFMLDAFAILLYWHNCRDQPTVLCLFFTYVLCYAPVLKFLTYYAHVKDLCSNTLTVLLEYI